MQRTITSALAAVFGASVAHASLAHEDHHRPHGRVGSLKVEEKAFGRAFDPSRAKRTIRIDMSDTMTGELGWRFTKPGTYYLRLLDSRSFRSGNDRQGNREVN